MVQISPLSSADVNAFVAVGMQSAQGAPQTSAPKFRFAKHLTADLEVQIEPQDIREGGDGLDYGLTWKVKQAVRGQIVVNARPEISGQFLAVALGGATWDAASAPAQFNYHTGHASFPWSTIIAQHPGSSMPLLLSDVLFTGFTLDARSGQPWQFTFPFIAITHGASQPAYVPMFYGDAPWIYYNSPTYVLGGLGDTTISRVQISMGLGVDELQAQQVTLDTVAVMNRDTNVTIERRFENPGVWQQVYYGASGNITPTQSVATSDLRAAVAYGAGITLRSLDFQAKLISLRQNQITGLDSDGKTVQESISAKVLKGATHALFAILKNGHASAYGS